MLRFTHQLRYRNHRRFGLDVPLPPVVDGESMLGRPGRINVCGSRFQTCRRNARESVRGGPHTMRDGVGYGAWVLEPKITFLTPPKSPRNRINQRIRLSIADSFFATAIHTPHTRAQLCAALCYFFAQIGACRSVIELIASCTAVNILP